MTKSDLQSEFSLAYVRAVAHAAGLGVQEAGRLMDGHGVDLLLYRTDAQGLRWEFRAQVKSWTGTPFGDPFPYDLRAKNYNDLAQLLQQVPIVLLLVVVPSDPADWVVHSEQELLLRHCGYWLSLRGSEPTVNEHTVRVLVPRSQVFDVAAASHLWDRVQAGGQP
jgi:hypothetical protein